MLPFSVVTENCRQNRTQKCSVNIFDVEIKWFENVHNINYSIGFLSMIKVHTPLPVFIFSKILFFSSFYSLFVIHSANVAMFRWTFLLLFVFFFLFFASVQMLWPLVCLQCVHCAFGMKSWRSVRYMFNIHLFLCSTFLLFSWKMRWIESAAFLSRDK